jgi:4'-phosphopantetheinyl transferase
VWRALLNGQPESRAGLMEVLSSDERERARRYVRVRDSDRFIAARAILRNVLGGYLGADPATLRFTYSNYGKPALEDPGYGWLHFNLSHSHDLAIVGVAVEAEIGVDVERIRDEIDIDALAARALDPTNAGLLPAEATTRRQAFFAQWTQQEAYWKAVGCGLLGLDGTGPAASGGYSLVELILGGDYKASLAIAGSRPRVVLRDWT